MGLMPVLAGGGVTGLLRRGEGLGSENSANHARLTFGHEHRHLHVVYTTALDTDHTVNKKRRNEG